MNYGLCILNVFFLHRKSTSLETIVLDVISERLKEENKTHIL